MKPARFEYHRPETVEETVGLLAELDDAELMAGNQSLGIVMANRLATPDHIIDINRVEELASIEVEEDRAWIGALSRHRDIERSDALRGTVPMFPEAAEQIAGPSVRNRGTLGGSLGEADPAGNYLAALVALDGEIQLVSIGEKRTVPAREYFIAYMFTDRREGELIEGASIDREAFPVDRTGMAFLEQKRAAQTWPTISAAASVRVEDPTDPDPVVEDARIALANAADIPLHVPEAEAALEGTRMTAEALDAAEAAATDAADPEAEMHADSEFKTELAGEYARRALQTAHGRAIDDVVPEDGDAAAVPDGGRASDGSNGGRPDA